MTIGPIPDETPNNLEEQLLLEQAKTGVAIEIQGTPFQLSVISYQLSAFLLEALELK
ncbi:MAG: hypothetical protein F6K48_12315 [Okeania sp. SIO3H1]|nr:hypothetical protein [Okeania sp. SIO3H1]